MRRLRRDLSLAALTGRDIFHVLSYVARDRAYHTLRYVKRRLIAP